MEYKNHFRDIFKQIPAIVNSGENLDDFMDKKIILQKQNTFEFLTKQTEDNSYKILIAFDDKELVGYCRFRKINNDTVYIYSLSVATNAQKQGIGTSLMLKALKTFNDVTQCHLKAFISNDQAHKFYTKLGFENIGTCSLDLNGKLIQDNNVAPTHINYRLIINKEYLH